MIYLRHIFWIPIKLILSIFPNSYERLVKLNIINILSYIGYSNSLNRMDKSIIEFFEYKKNGVCLEVGGADGIDQSNSLHLERKYNWRSYLVEPTTDQFNLLRKYRKDAVSQRCAFVSYDSYVSEKNIEIKLNNLQSTIVSEESNSESEKTELVPKNTLDIFFIDHGIRHLDLLILDVEGYEIEVLEGYKKDQSVIDFMLVEASDFETFDSYAKSRNWKLIKHIGTDHLYSLK
jgi:FkbM family methyltransferase